MSRIRTPDHREASLALYNVVALNARGARTINRSQAAKILGEILGVDEAAARAWLRGDFKVHPLTRENFLKFTRAYRGKRGLRDAARIAELARYLYGAEYERALELLDPQDRVVAEEEQNIPPQVSEHPSLADALFDLIHSYPLEEVRCALVEVMVRLL